MTTHELVALQRRAFNAFNPRPVDERLDQLEMLQKALIQRRDALVQALWEDLGKGPEEAEETEIGPVLGEMTFMLNRLKRWARPRNVLLPARMLPGRGLVLREAYGVVLILSSWQMPVRMSLLPLISALAAGNHCVLRPSAYAPATGKAVEGLISSCFPVEQAAVTAGGRDDTQALLEEQFDFIFASGSQGLGRAVLEKAARHITPVALELTGKNPCVVEESADLKAAAERIAWGKAVCAGQTNLAPDYLLVQESVRDKLLPLIRDAWTARYGKALENVNWPRMVNEKHYQRVMQLIQGEEIFCGGEGDGQRIAPTLLTGVSWDSPIMQGEIQGPVLPVVTFQTVEEALQAVSGREKPLALYLFTRRANVREQFLREIPCGSVCVNGALIQAQCPRLPFGGVGKSGMGRWHGKASFELFTYEKSAALL